MYRSGKYVEHILHALRKRGEIFDILDSHRTQQAQEGEREAYYPVSIYCPKCGKDTTKIHSLSDDCTVAEFSCACGHEGSFNFTTDFNCKLAWKIDWPMRWLYEGVDFEPGGKDHAARHGSYDTSKDISKKIFDNESQPPNSLHLNRQLPISYFYLNTGVYTKDRLPKQPSYQQQTMTLTQQIVVGQSA
jgi:lysyl-tRNA synthetase class 1